MELMNELFCPYTGIGKGTKKRTRKPSGIPVHTRFAAPYARAYEKVI